MSKKLIIVGAGGSGREIAEIIKVINQSGKQSLEILGFLDDNVLLKGTKVLGIPVLGDISKSVEFKDCVFANSIAHPEQPALRKKIYERFYTNSDKLLPLVHPSVNLASSCVVGHGSIIFPGCTIGACVEIGENCLLNYNSSVGHDSKIADHSVLASGVSISGKNKIGSSVYVGAGSATKHDITIGDDVLIAAGTVLIKNVGCGKKVIQDRRTFTLPKY